MAYGCWLTRPALAQKKRLSFLLFWGFIADDDETPKTAVWKENFGVAFSN